MGRSLESLPFDLAAVEAGRIPGSIVERFAELEKSPMFRWLLQFGGFKERLLANDLFLAKVAMECGVGVFTKMGGHSNVANELLFQFVFPEKPSALVKLLDAFSPRWNSSLSHYRSQGENGANVLVGIQVPDKYMEEFQSQAKNLGYEYSDEKTNEAFRLLML